MNDDIVSRVREIDGRLAGVETLLYGDDRTKRPGVVEEMRNLTSALQDQTEAIRRIMIVLGWVAILLFVTIGTLALAILA